MVRAGVIERRRCSEEGPPDHSSQEPSKKAHYRTEGAAVLPTRRKGSLAGKLERGKCAANESS